MKKIPLISIVLFCMNFGICAQTLDNNTRTWDESSENELANIRYNSKNPVRLSYNALRTFGVAVVDYGLRRGDFHAPGTSGKVNDLNVYIAGLQNVGKFDVSGYIRYINQQQRDKRWNSTLGLRWDNPLILADTINSQQSVEQFDMNATGAFQINDSWKLGLSISLQTGTLSDQTDPRPETQFSNLPITVGAEYRLTDKFSLGLNTGVRLFSSEINHHIEDPQKNYVYYLMRGNGDYYRRSSADVSGYSREYKGTSYNGAVQLNYQFSDKISDLLEFGIDAGHENATDEGGILFKGGDYDFTEFAVSNRIIIKNSDALLHNIIFSANIDKGEVNWYDQRKVLDTEHGNRTYYLTLGKYKAHENNYIKASAEYRIDFLKKGKQDMFLDFRTGIRNFNNKQFNTNIDIQKATNINFLLAAGKKCQFKKVNLNTSVYAGYSFATGDDFTDGSSYANENIAVEYTLPYYQFEISKRYDIGAKVDFGMPLSKQIYGGAFITVDSHIYADNGKYINVYKGTSFTTTKLGLYLKF